MLDHENDNCREQFEAWATKDAASVGRKLVIDREGDWYLGKDAQFLDLGWASWQASREALPPGSPSPAAFAGFTVVRDRAMHPNTMVVGDRVFEFLKEDRS